MHTTRSRQRMKGTVGTLVKKFSLLLNCLYTNRIALAFERVCELAKEFNAATGTCLYSIHKCIKRVRG